MSQACAARRFCTPPPGRLRASTTSWGRRQTTPECGGRWSTSSGGPPSHRFHRAPRSGRHRRPNVSGCRRCGSSPSASGHVAVFVPLLDPFFPVELMTVPPTPVRKTVHALAGITVDEHHRRPAVPGKLAVHLHRARHRPHGGRGPTGKGPPLAHAVGPAKSLHQRPEHHRASRGSPESRR